MIREGAKVSYVGYPDEAGLAVGDRGKVISASGESSHVRWESGTRTGSISLVENMDLVVGASAPARTYDAFEGQSLVTVAVRDTYDAAGPVALLNALNEEGHLATFAAIAESALEQVAAQITQDPSMREVLGHLEPEEQAGFVTLAAGVLLRDAFGSPE
jgi:hypothetical protein